MAVLFYTHKTQERNMEYKQTPLMLVVRAVTVWWWLGLLTLGGIIAYDILSWKRAALILKDGSLTLSFGVITQNSRELPYKNIQTVDVHQSVLGQILGYGHVLITTANANAPVMFKYVDKPQIVREMIQSKLRG
jgi:uncharacterized membrane protein YdbT with pleckstrin-like domain